jgi:hypothetical protein
MSRTNSTITGLSVCSIAFAFCTAACFGQLVFTDITLQAGTGGPTKTDELGGHGVIFADADKDGLPDLYITMIFDTAQWSPPQPLRQIRSSQSKALRQDTNELGLLPCTNQVVSAIDSRAEFGESFRAGCFCGQKIRFSPCPEWEDTL